MNKELEIQQKYKNGESVIELSKHYDLTRERIYQILRKMPDFRRVSKELAKEKTESNQEKYQNKYSEYIPEIISRRLQGESVLSISKQLKIPYPALKTMLKGSPYANTKQARKERNKQIRRQYHAGKTQLELARDFNMSQSSISAIVLKKKP